MRYLGVPMIRQEKSMSCWHASARMIWGYRYMQSINPMNIVYQANTGLSPAQFINLAKTLGLESIPFIIQSYSWEGIADLLRSYGPLWAAGYWYGFAHVIVITGVYPDGRLFVNDPGSGPKVHDVKFFNDRVASNVMNPVMYLPSSRANHIGYGTYFRY